MIAISILTCLLVVIIVDTQSNETPDEGEEVVENIEKHVENYQAVISCTIFATKTEEAKDNATGNQTSHDPVIH